MDATIGEWKSWLDIVELRAQFEDVSESKIARVAEARVIEQDVRRTRANEPFFRSKKVRTLMHQALLKYCGFHNVNYMQGLNEILAPLLVLGMSKNSLSDTKVLCEFPSLGQNSADGRDDDDMALNVPGAESWDSLESDVSFGSTDDGNHEFEANLAIFESLVAKLSPVTFSTEGVQALQSQLASFHLLLYYFEADLSAFLARESMTADIYAPSWFITLFARRSPASIALYLWKKILVEKKQPSFIILLGVALMRIHKNFLLSVPSELLPETIVRLHFRTTEEVDVAFARALQLEAATPASFVDDMQRLGFDASLPEADRAPGLYEIMYRPCLMIKADDVALMIMMPISDSVSSAASSTPSSLGPPHSRSASPFPNLLSPLGSEPTNSAAPAAGPTAPTTAVPTWAEESSIVDAALEEQATKPIPLKTTMLARSIPSLLMIPSSDPMLTPTTAGGAMGTPTTAGGAMGTPTTAGGAMGTPTTAGGAMGTPTTAGGPMGTPTTAGGAMGTSAFTRKQQTTAASASSSSPLSLLVPTPIEEVSDPQPPLFPLSLPAVPEVPPDPTSTSFPGTSFSPLVCSSHPWTSPVPICDHEQHPDRKMPPLTPGDTQAQAQAGASCPHIRYLLLDCRSDDQQHLSIEGALHFRPDIVDEICRAAQSQQISSDNEPNFSLLTPTAAATLALLWSCRGEDTHFAVVGSDFGNSGGTSKPHSPPHGNGHGHVVGTSNASLLPSTSHSSTLGNSPPSDLGSASRPSQATSPPHHSQGYAVSTPKSAGAHGRRNPSPGQRASPRSCPSPVSSSAQVAGHATASVDVPRSDSPPTHSTSSSSSSSSPPCSIAAGGASTPHSPKMELESLVSVKKRLAREGHLLPCNQLATALLILGFSRVSIVRGAGLASDAPGSGRDEEPESSEGSIGNSTRTSIDEGGEGGAGAGIGASHLQVLPDGFEELSPFLSSPTDGFAALAHSLALRGACAHGGVIRVPQDPLFAHKVHQFALSMSHSSQSTHLSTRSRSSSASSFEPDMTKVQAVVEKKALGKSMLGLESLLRRLGGLHEGFMESVLLSSMNIFSSRATDPLMAGPKGDSGDGNGTDDDVIDNLLAKLRLHSETQSSINGKAHAREVKRCTYALAPIADDVLALQKKLGTVRKSLELAASLSSTAVTELTTKAQLSSRARANPRSECMDDLPVPLLRSKIDVSRGDVRHGKSNS